MKIFFLALCVSSTYKTVISQKDPPEVHWFAPFYSGGGYCSEAIAFVHSLDQSGLRVSITQHGDGYDADFVNGLPRSTAKMLTRMGRQHIHWRSESVAVCHSEPGAWHPPRWPTARCPPPGVGFKVGRTMFETDRLPDGWHLRLNKMDQVWVPTVFHLTIFEAAGVDASKLRVLGEPVDVDFFDPSRVATPLPLPGVEPGRTYVFLSIFKWEERKGTDVLFDAYLKEFDASDDVILCVLTRAYHSEAGDWEQFADARAREQGRPVSELPRVWFQPQVPQDDLPSLYAAADTFVLPSRGEGWGRPHVEAMAMAMPVIATNWSGPTEYMHPDNSYPLPIQGLTPVRDGPFKGHLWADPSVRELRRLMREVFTNRDAAAEKGAQARRDMIKHYSPQVLGERAKVLLLNLTSHREDPSLKTEL